MGTQLRASTLYPVLLCLTLGSSSALAQSSPSSGPAEATGAPVVLGTETLFDVYTRTGSFSPQERAHAISARLERIARDHFADLDHITVQEVEGASDIILTDTVVMTVTDADARAAGLARAELADQLAAKIKAAVQRRTAELSPRTLALGGLYSLLCTLAFVILLFGLSRIQRRVKAAISRARPAHRPLEPQRLAVFWSELFVHGLQWLLRVIFFACTIFLVYVYVPLIFSFFPQTRGYSAKLLRYIEVPLVSAGRALVDYIPNAINIALVALIARLLLKVIHLGFVAVERRHLLVTNFYPEWAMPTYRLIRFIVLIFAATLIFPYVPGSGSDAFKSMSLFVGAMLSLGSSGAVANVIAGVVLTYMRPFKVGDRVQIADTAGDVIEKNLLVTRIRTVKNVDTTVPNAMVLGSHIINFSSSAPQASLILHSHVTIGYDAPWRKVHELLIQAALRTEHLLKEPAPFVLQTSLDDSYVSYEINAYTNKPNEMAAIYTGLHQNIQDAFNEAGVEIMSPQYHAHRDGNRSTIQATFGKKPSEAPAFRVQFLGTRADESADPSIGRRDGQQRSSS